MWYSKNKYYSTKKFNGFDSKFEAGVFNELKLRQKAGEILEIEKQVNIPLIVNGYNIGTYIIDFIAYRKDGVAEYTEAKGFPTALWKLKFKILEAMLSDNPNAELIVIWQGKPKKMRRIKKARIGLKNEMV